MFIVVVLVWLFMPAAAGAAGDIAIRVSNPDAGAEEGYEGNTINSVLSTPMVTYGDNKIMGTLRVTGKKDVAVPLRPGNKIMVTLPPGTCYMRAPTAENYKNYVVWPQILDGSKNQIQDAGKKAGVSFIAGTPRSITIEVNNIDFSGETAVLDFVFDRAAYSTVRVTRLLDLEKVFRQDPDGRVTRLQFFEAMADLTLPFPSCPVRLITDHGKLLYERFSDLNMFQPREIEKIKPLVDSGLISGYQGQLDLNKYITRAEAFHMAGGLYGQAGPKPAFKDKLPEWATGINAAAAKKITVGYPDGTFRPGQFITKSEVLTLFQKMIESYEVK